MTNAWIVPVWTKRIDRTKPMLVCYITGASSADEALSQVKAFVVDLEGEDFREPAPVKDETAQALGVQPGLTWML
ncbi:hypothetical protein [Hoeflea sp.]|uniref:hypothetical protein n=1 Tax=Hoeflea sp. TaxID=1940281 RepID=UPI003B52E1CB